jgi:carbonic anhydrase/acetyltransferase-like protein (isoleucine patch superfamily)
MTHRTRWRRGAIIACTLLGLALAPIVVPRLVSPAAAATKTLYIPPSWASTGEVPWTQDRTKESANFILLWGEKSGTDPKSAPSPYNFDPDNILSQLETLYSFYVNTMKFTPETGLLAQYKIDVIVTQTWNRTELNAWATGGSADGKVGVINIAPGAAQPGSWGLAHELGHVFQNYTFLGRPGVGLTDPSAGTFWETSAEFMAMQVYPHTAAGDLTRFLRTENLYWSSSRHHYGNWMLMQYIVDRDGLAMFNRIWNEAKNNEHPLEVYRRITGITQAELNRRIGEYAQRNVTWDYSNRANVMPFINSLYPFVTAYNGVQVDAVNTATGHYRIPDALAPSDFGYNKVRLIPSTDGGLIRLHFKGHANSAAQSGWTYGFVALKNGTPRYSPIYSSADDTVSFQTQPGERDVYLVVTGAPATVHHYAYLDGYPKNYRYPYEFRLDGAAPSGYEPGYTKPAAPGGGHWHSNGGGWVDNRANVAASAYVGPRAAVYGNSTVSGNARIEGLSWVNSGATVTGNAVVRDSALVQGGANLSGNIVVGGDAEPSTACSSGTYLMFAPDRGCDGQGGETDVNPTFGNFTDGELAIGTPTSPSPSVTPTAASPSASPSTSPSATATATGPAGTACTAAYAVTSSWQGGFQGEVTVKAGTSAITGWTVSWTFASGQTVTQSWGTVMTGSGPTISAQNAAWNGALAANATTTFGFIANAPTTNQSPTPTCAAR